MCFSVDEESGASLEAQVICAFVSMWTATRRAGKPQGTRLCGKSACLPIHDLHIDHNEPC